MRFHSINTSFFFTLLLSFFLISCSGGSDQGQKDKEQEKDKDKKKEKKESASSKKEEKEELTAAKFANAVRQRIVEKAKENGGYLEFDDPRTGKMVKVELQKVVEKSVRKSAKDVRLVCGKFKGVDNSKNYDIDFFLEGNEPSSLKPAREPLFHKIDGEAEHTYVKNDQGFVEPKKVEEGSAKNSKEEGDKKDKKMKKGNPKKGAAEEGEVMKKNS